MAAIIADNIISPLGSSSGANYQAVKAGKTALRLHNHKFNLPFPFTAALFSEEQKEEFTIDGLTLFESLAVTSIRKALEGSQIPMDSRTCLVLSSTKQNISLLNIEGNTPENVLYPGRSAERIAQTVGLSTTPIIVCNACISGVSALILGNRLIEKQEYDYVIVCGIDLQSSFIISGFHSLKALSETPCRPFDIERTGLNLGEAAATVILGKVSQTDSWNIAGSAIRNDAYHVSSPAPKADGCLMTLEAVMKGQDASKLSVINAHGTATLYNDQMESVAIAAAGLSDVPMNSLKGYYGHTLGTSGLLETIVTMHSVAHGELPGTRGFSEIGVSGRVNISAQPMPVSKQSFVKVISGFGGCNAAVYCALNAPSPSQQYTANTYSVEHHVRITPPSDLTEIYKQQIGNYPKFYKMDKLSQLGFIASELLLKQESPRKEQCADRAVVLFNHSSSGWVDREYAKSITVGDDYFPSPSLFVYTLPNIVCGEIAVRNGYHAETAFYILPHKDEEMMHQVLASTFLDETIQSILTGWIDYEDDQHFEAELKLIKR